MRSKYEVILWRKSLYRPIIDMLEISHGVHESLYFVIGATSPTNVSEQVLAICYWGVLMKCIFPLVCDIPLIIFIELQTSAFIWIWNVVAKTIFPELQLSDFCKKTCE